jgi:hypothetical protein
MTPTAASRTSGHKPNSCLRRLIKAAILLLSSTLRVIARRRGSAELYCSS